MTSIQIASNPFAQMMDPQAVIAAVERSARLQALHSRVCRPLDKPLAAAGEPGSDANAFDASLDAAADGDAAAAPEGNGASPSDGDAVRT